ncbi:MAG: phage/plasmid primase, P4 family [Clostridiaceae bacterium]|nr:phage/plasmid primase, P4 family [Clostridiaceae bacterium]
MENKDMLAVIKKNTAEEIEPMLPVAPGQSQTNQSAPGTVSAQPSPERQALISSLASVEKIEDYLASPGAHLSMEELKQLKLWLCWRLEDKVDKSTGEVKSTKVPCDAKGKIGATRGYFKRWMTYEKAVKVAKERGYQGVGFVIPKGMFFVDIDHHAPSDPFAADRLERFSATYAELSQSGSGIHIYGLCDFSRIPNDNGKWPERYYKKNSRNNIEVYVGGYTDRYAVCTCNSLNGCEFTNRTDALLKTLDMDMVRATAADGSSLPEIHREWDIEALIEKMENAKNGEKFQKLFQNKDISDYGSESEADAALAAMIAFWVGNDPETIMQIIEQSALYDDKWQRQDYQKSTIAAGIRACNGTFHKDVMPKERPPFVYEDKNGNERVSAAKLAIYAREHMHYFIVRDSGLTGDLLYVYKDGAYRVYSERMFQGAIKQFIIDYDPFLVRMTDVREAFANLTTDLQSIRYDELDDNEDIINFQNGLLHLPTMKLLPHTPEVRSTIQLPCKWVPPVLRPDGSWQLLPAPNYEKFMSDLTDGDSGKIQLSEEFSGVTISNVRGYRFKKAIFYLGDGDTGKSQLKKLVEMLLGKGHFTGIDLKELEARFGTGNIYGKRLAGSSDMSYMSISELKIFKRCTGGDSIFAEFKGMQGFEFTYGGMLWFCMNRLPKFGGDDGEWVYDRIMIIKCGSRIPKEKQDKHILEKMYAEREAIVQRFVLALKGVIANGYNFTESAAVLTERESYKQENNNAVKFWIECMEPIPAASRDEYTTTKIYKMYRTWCTTFRNGFSKGIDEFDSDIASHLGVPRKDLYQRGGAGTHYAGWRFKQDVRGSIARCEWSSFGLLDSDAADGMMDARRIG